MRDEMIYFADMVPDASGGKDPYGDPAMELKLSDAVFAELKSIGQSEFYQAQTAGQKPEIKFKLTDYMDYQGQRYLIHEGVQVHCPEDVPYRQQRAGDYMLWRCEGCRCRRQ